VELQFGFGKDSLAAHHPLHKRAEDARVPLGIEHVDDLHRVKRAPLRAGTLAAGQLLNVGRAQEQAHGFSGLMQWPNSSHSM
jgi:hypothetical protein